jgi:hypothetical protein
LSFKSSTFIFKFEKIFNNISGSKVHIKDEYIRGNIIVVILEIIKDKDTLEIEIDFKNM